ADPEGAVALFAAKLAPVRGWFLRDFRRGGLSGCCLGRRRDQDVGRRFARPSGVRSDRRLGHCLDLDVGCLGGLAAFLLLAGLAPRCGGLLLGHGGISSLWVAVAGAPPVAAPATGSDSYLSSREDIQAIPTVFSG